MRMNETIQNIHVMRPSNLHHWLKKQKTTQKTKKKGAVIGEAELGRDQRRAKNRRETQYERAGVLHGGRWQPSVPRANERPRRWRLKMASVSDDCSTTDDPIKPFLRLLRANARLQGCKKRVVIGRIQRGRNLLSGTWAMKVRALVMYDIFTGATESFLSWN